MKDEPLITCAVLILLIPIFLALFSAGTMFLWNWIMPYLFHLPKINFWMAAGVLVLSGLITGGIKVTNK